LQLNRAGGKCDAGQLGSLSAPNTLPVFGLTIWTCLQAKQLTPSYVSSPFTDPLSASQPCTRWPVLGQRKSRVAMLKLSRFGDFGFEVTQVGMQFEPRASHRVGQLVICAVRTGAGGKSRPVTCPLRIRALAKGLLASKRLLKWSVGHPAPRARRASCLGSTPGRQSRSPFAMSRTEASVCPPASVPKNTGADA